MPHLRRGDCKVRYRGSTATVVQNEISKKIRVKVGGTRSPAEASPPRSSAGVSQLEAKPTNSLVPALDPGEKKNGMEWVRLGSSRWLQVGQRIQGGANGRAAGTRNRKLSSVGLGRFEVNFQLAIRSSLGWERFDTRRESRIGRILQKSALLGGFLAWLQGSRTGPMSSYRALASIFASSTALCWVCSA